MDNTLFAIDNSQVYAVKARSYCARIVIQEDYDSISPPTCDLAQYKVVSGSQPGQSAAYGANGVKVSKGTVAIYTKPGGYVPEEIAGGIKTASGSCTVQQVEGQEV
jgi:hypothetical protein